MTRPTIAVVITVLNESNTIKSLIYSLINQTLPANEIIVVDGGSTDDTYQKLLSLRDKYSTLKLLKKVGNRSVGRNYAVSKTNSTIIAFTDAGCIPDPDWLYQLTQKFLSSNNNKFVISGYYRGVYKNIFEKCLIPFVLVMPNKVNENKFLPSTRSMAMYRHQFIASGGFDENLSYNEDYDYAIRLKIQGYLFVFASQAIVSWFPRENILSAILMFFYYAVGDTQAGIYRPKVIILFIRYLILFGLLGVCIVKPLFIGPLIFVSGIYLIWAIIKNYQYVNHPAAVIFLPILQIASDISVIMGSIYGFIYKPSRKQLTIQISWLTGLRLFIRIGTMVRLIILARILSPYHFGTFTVVATTLGLLEIIFETGINSVLIQEQDNAKNIFPTAWIISIIRGTVISTIMLALSKPISGYFAVPAAANLIIWAALIPLIRGFINPAIINFQRHLQFNREFFYRGILFIVETFALVGWAYFTNSAYSFIFGLIIASLAEVILSFILITPRPTWEFKPNIIVQIFKQGKWITLYGICDYLYTNFDNIIVGRMLGVSSLGIYQNAYKLSTLGVSESMEVYQKYAFPALSSQYKLGNANFSQMKLFMKNIILIQILISLTLFIFAPVIVNIILGLEWIEAVPIVRILSFLGLFRTIAHIVNPWLLAQKKTNMLFQIIFVSLITLLLTIYPLTRSLGMPGTALSAVLGAVSASIFSYFYILPNIYGRR